MTGGPWWPPHFFAAVMLVVSVYCSARLLVARRWRRRIHVDVNVAHVTMGVAMAGMLIPSLRTLPTGLWEAVFVALAAWFSVRSVGFASRHLRHGPDQDLHYVSHYLTHLVMACAMLYMYLAPAPPAASGAAMVMGASPATADFTALPLFFVLVLVVSAVWHVDTLSRSPLRPLVLVGSRSAGPDPGGGVNGDGAQAEGIAWGEGTGGEGGPGDRPFLAPRLEGLCHIAMCITMGYMLVLLF
jgi:hypothetical protein